MSSPAEQAAPRAPSPAEPADSEQQIDKSKADPLIIEDLKFPPEEEVALLEESHNQKLQANKLFTSRQYSEAIQGYDLALSSCPDYLDYEGAVIKSNIAACHVKLEDWKSAISAADASLEALTRLEEAKQKRKPDEAETETKKRGNGVSKSSRAEEEEGEEEVEDIVSPGASRIGPITISKNGDDRSKREQDITRIRTKALLRRAKARSEIGGWSALAGAEEGKSSIPSEPHIYSKSRWDPKRVLAVMLTEGITIDYKTLSTMPSLSVQDKRYVTQQLRVLHPRIEAAKQKEMGEMMGKLKELGNGLLKPFGLSTDMFQMKKDENSGGYNLQFNQGGN